MTDSPTNKPEVIPNCDPTWDYAEIWAELGSMQDTIAGLISTLGSNKASSSNGSVDFHLCKELSQIKQQCNDLLNCLSEAQTFKSPTERYLELSYNQNQLMIQRLEALGEQLVQVNVSLLTIKTNFAMLAIGLSDDQEQS